MGGDPVYHSTYAEWKREYDPADERTDRTEYNHTSIICWAISNEISLQGVTEDLLENHRILNDLIHEMDPSRVSAMANLFMLETDSPLVTLPDIRGYNLYYGWYVGEMEDNDAWFDKFHEEHPDVVIGLTEYGADSTIKLQSPKPEKRRLYGKLSGRIP